MRIAVWHNLPSGGGKRALYYHIKGLVERGHYVEFWQPDTADEDDLPLSVFGKEHVLPLKEELKKVGKIKKKLSFFFLQEQIDIVKRHCMQCAKQINHGEFDLVFVNSCKFFYMSFLGLYLDIPKAIYLGEPCRKLYEAIPKSVWMGLNRMTSWKMLLTDMRKRINDLSRVYSYRIQVREEWEAARTYDLILVNSIFSRESVLRAYGIESKVCYLGVDSNLFKPPDKSIEKYVIGLGTVTYLKGVDRAIRAIGSVPPHKRPILIWISNWHSEVYLKEMQRLASSLQVEFIIKSNISDNEVMEKLGKAAVMIYTPRNEPFGFAPLEANACGTPVVAIAEGGVRESIEHGVNGILIDNDNPKKIGEEIINFTENLDYARDFGERARKHVIENWNFNNVADNLERNLSSMMKTKLQEK